VKEGTQRRKTAKLHWKLTNPGSCETQKIFVLFQLLFNFTTNPLQEMADLHTNPQIDLAFDYVNNTNKNIFLTGKAGTGKTTFLHRIKNEALKRSVVVAPTGVAAINAGGMTIHSFFQLPFGPYLPGNTRDVSRQRKFSGDKIRLIQSLDLLIIDEISMVRADLLDGIDDVLRRYKDHYKPFGGVQLLMIGDLHQLPPVVKDEEWHLLRTHYQTPYFFSSKALQGTEPVTIELKHIYRQSDNTFIDLLNKVRNNKMDADVLDTLNSRYIAHFQPREEDAYITLSTHNASAQEINAQKLAGIPKPSLTYKAHITGEFPAHAFPTEEVLECKIDAQVMFVKNDMSREKRYYNGKIGKITRVQEATIYVKCPGEVEEIAVSPVEWDNIKYTLNEKTKEVSEEIVGTFTQYPLKLAWAITIHKSQGLTFERAIIDAQAAFAHGQVYVALSRCKSFEGIVLRSKIAYSSVRTDSTVKNYTEEADKNAPDEIHLKHSKVQFQQTLIRELFDFSALKRIFDQSERVFATHEKALLGDLYGQLKVMRMEADAHIFSIADKFGSQLQQFFAQAGLPEENEDLQARIQKASAWFAEKLSTVMLPTLTNIRVVTDNQAAKKAALESLENLQKQIFVKKTCFTAIKDVFSTHNYLKTKTSADLDFQAAQRQSAPSAGKAEVLPDTPHPVLFTRLKKWREETAEVHKVERYAVLPTKSLLELVRVLPGSMERLKQVKGIGAVKSGLFGADILDIIQNYCTSNHIETNDLMLPPVVLKPDTKVLSFDLYKAGKSMDEIAEERGMVRSTIEGHLAHFVGLGELDILDLMAAEKVRQIEQFFLANNTATSGEAKAQLGESYSYGEIKLVLKYMEKSGAVE